MPVWRIEDDCIAKAAKLTLNYSGPNPFSIYHKMRDIIMSVVLVKKEHIWERDFRWDDLGEPKGFYIRLYINKAMDAKTKILFELIFQGKQPSDKSKPGSLVMTISARIFTDYTLDTAFQQSLLYRSFLKIYHKIFYNDVRRRFLSDCGNFIDKIFTRVRTEFNLETK